MALDAAQGLPWGFAFGFAALCVGFGGFVGAQADHGDAPQCVVSVGGCRLGRGRWRTLWPEDASTEPTAHRAAKEASLRMRSGLSPTATGQTGGGFGSLRGGCRGSTGLAWAHKRRSRVSEVFGLTGERVVAPG